MDIATIEDVRRIMREELREALHAVRPEPWLDTAGAARYLATTPASIRDMVRRGTLPHHRPEGTARLLFRPSELDAWVKGSA
jgi:excisionase family DNA binding protein